MISETTFVQSPPVSVLTSSKFIGLEESLSRRLSKCQVSKSIGVAILGFLSVADLLSIYYMDYHIGIIQLKYTVLKLVGKRVQ